MQKLKVFNRLDLWHFLTLIIFICIILIELVLFSS